MERTFRLPTAAVPVRGDPQILSSTLVDSTGKIVTDATFCFGNKCNDCGCYHDCSCEDYDPCPCEDDDHCYCDPKCSEDCSCYHYGGPG